MTHHSSAFRLLAAFTAGSLLLAGMPALAQQDNAGPVVDPPSRVGRIARLVGTVSFHAAGATDWEPAGLNLPVTSGSGIWTEPGASADVEVGDGRIVLDGGTQLEVPTLDDQTLVADENQGSLYMRVRSMAQGETITLRTPRGTVTIERPGGYVVSAGDSATPTQVTVVEGAAQFAGPGVTQELGPHRTLSVTGADTFVGSVGPEQMPAFALAVSRPLPVPIGPSAPPPAVAQMTGGDALYDTGTWDQSPEYGHVWYPPVSVGWVPYREGHWAFIAPWGWTWVDDAPWGFAPFHYGRWVQVGPRWGWIPVLPGVAIGYRPVYAPALVAFVGFGAGVAIGMSLRNPVGWVPLGPREEYRPPYRVSNTYIRNVNVTNVTNVTNITNVQRGPASYMNRGAATVVSGATMAGSQPVGRAFQSGRNVNFSVVQPLAAPSVSPTRGTVGVTPHLAQQMNLPAAPTGVPARPAAPGPTVRPQAQGGIPPLQPHNTAMPAGTQAGRPAPAPQAVRLPAAPTQGTAAGALPALRPATPAGQAPARPPVPGMISRPATPAPAAPVAPQLAGPRPVSPQAAPSRPAPPQPAAQAPRPVQQPSVPRPAQQAAPQAQTSRPMPQVVTPRSEPQAARPAPQAPVHVEAARPAPPPMQRVEPTRSAPAAQPRQESHQKSCPPNRPNC